jgi:hypothetical protein
MFLPTNKRLVNTLVSLFGIFLLLYLNLFFSDIESLTYTYTYIFNFDLDRH